MVEPTSCAVHAMDVLRPTVGAEALIIGAGPSGLVLAQLLKLNGAVRVVLAANKSIKTETAKRLDIADEIIELDRHNATTQWDKLKLDNPYGFDVVVEATGSEVVTNKSLDYVRRGGTYVISDLPLWLDSYTALSSLLLYGVNSASDQVHWSPARIFRDEITVRVGHPYI